jgi:hypothetical protein
MAIRNFWSLNVDEVLVATKLQEKLKNKGYEVFFPLRTQLKDIDLILLNLKNNEARTIQVKGSRSYPPPKREKKHFGDGEGGWIQIRKEKIFENENSVDYLIFLIHLLEQGKARMEIKPYYLVIPFDEFRKILIDHNRKPLKNGTYKFFIWINPKKKTATEFAERNNEIDLTKYLDNFGIIE